VDLDVDWGGFPGGVGEGFRWGVGGGFGVFITVENYVEKCGKRVERRVGKKRGKSLEKGKLQSDMEL
jgi:hypothetical protein